MNKFRDFINNLVEGAKELLADNPIERRIKEVDEWDGSASRWPSTEDYCNDCLINLNEGDPEDWTQANCKLPIREPGDSKDTFVDKAVFVAAGGNGIQAVDAPEADKKAAANQIIDVYKEMDLVAPDAVFEIAGKELPEDNERAISFEQIREQVWSLTFQDGWLIDVFDDAGQMYALLASEGQLLRQQLGIVNDQVELAGEPFMVSIDHPAIQTRTTIQRQKDGRYRWFSISATSVLNRVGEIDSRELFDSFIAHIDETGEYPIRQFYHQGENFRTGQCDFVTRDNNCLITSGIFDDTKLAKMEIQARKTEPNYWGESIGYLPTNNPEMFEIQEGVNIPVYTTGVFREISTLPEKQAANLFTVTIQQEEVNRMLTGKVKEAFVKLFGDDEEAAEQWLTQNVDDLNRSIQESGMITRDKEDDEQEPEPATVDREISEALNGFQEQVQNLITAVETLNANQGDIVKRLDILQAESEERFGNLERSKAEDLQEAIVNMPSVPVVERLTYSPRQGNKQSNGKMVTMADHAKSIKSHY